MVKYYIFLSKIKQDTEDRILNFLTTHTKCWKIQEMDIFILLHIQYVAQNIIRYPLGKSYFYVFV